MNFLKTRRFTAIVGVLAIGSLGVILHGMGASTDSPALVSIAADAMTDWTHSGFGFLRQPNGINSSPDDPFLASRTENKAVVTIPYATNFGPVQNVNVYLVRNQKTNEWKAISFSDGGGTLHPVVDGCGLCGADKPYKPTQKWPD